MAAPCRYTMWIELTGKVSGKRLFVNTDCIFIVGTNKQDETEIYMTEGKYPFFVQETPEQIMEMMGDGTCGCGQQTAEHVVDESGHKLMCSKCYSLNISIRYINLDHKTTDYECLVCGRRWFASWTDAEHAEYGVNREQIKYRVDTQPERNTLCPECGGQPVTIYSAERDEVGWIVTFDCPECSHMWRVPCAKVRMELWSTECEEATEKSPKYRWDEPVFCQAWGAPMHKTDVLFEPGVGGYVSGAFFDWEWKVLHTVKLTSIHVGSSYHAKTWDNGIARSLVDAQLACEKAYEEYKERQND